MSPWVSETAIANVHPSLAGKKVQIIMLPSQYQRLNDIRAVKRIKDADVFGGLVHAKLYMFRHEDGSSTAIFGSANLTRSPMEELTVTSTDPGLNFKLEESLKTFRSHSSRWM